MSISCDGRREKEAAAAGGDSARDSFARTVDSLLLDTEMHELRARILDTANHRLLVGSPEALIFAHPHGNAWFVPVKLFARQYGAYVDVNCTRNKFARSAPQFSRLMQRG
jgi:hypothetical protein